MLRCLRLFFFAISLNKEKCDEGLSFLGGKHIKPITFSFNSLIQYPIKSEDSKTEIILMKDEILAQPNYWRNYLDDIAKNDVDPVVREAAKKRSQIQGFIESRRSIELRSSH